MKSASLTYPAIFLLSAASLSFEINLTRLFSVSQFYHFAFMIVSLALLGMAVSGSALAIFRGWGRANPYGVLAGLCLAASASILGSFCIINWLPFDSYSIAHDFHQVLILALHYVALAAPFFFCGLAVGLWIDVNPAAAPGIYSANLLGSALGCILALVLPGLLGAEGLIVFSSMLAAWGGVVLAVVQLRPFIPGGNGSNGKVWRVKLSLILALSLALVIFGTVDFSARVCGHPWTSWLDLRLSPYKSLSYALQYPGAEVVSTRWNAFSRVDLVQSRGIHSLPGLSYRFLEPPPPQMGLLVDGDDLSAVLLPGTDLAFTAYLPQAAAYRLRPGANALVLEARGGLDVWTALALGAGQVTAVESNPLVIAAAGEVYRQPGVTLAVETGRSYTNHCRRVYDVVALPLTHVYRPVSSGAYSLTEDYMATVEAISGAFNCLAPDGILAITRWLQTPPSEELRTFALVLSALEGMGLDAPGRVVAFRGYNTATILAKTRPFTGDELAEIRSFTATRAFDLITAPDIRPDEVNRYNILPEPIYTTLFNDLLNAHPRSAFFDSYPYDITPPVDDKPFFGHLFKWSQAPQVLDALGKTWQPFGGAGYFVLLLLLVIIVLLSGLSVLLPLVISLRMRPNPRTDVPGLRLVAVALLYFGLLGLGFMFVEIPLFQHFILYLGHPAYALTTVLFSLLLFSSLGSRMANRLALRPAILALVMVLLVLSSILPAIFQASLGFELLLRIGLTASVLALPGFLMGVLFPKGILMLREKAPVLIPWAWGINGVASVISSVLAALLALSFGFQLVLYLGAVCYLGAWFMARETGLFSSPAPRR